MASPKSPSANHSAPQKAQPKVLYRKYRPTKLADVIGQEQITSVLSKSLSQGKIAHAYLFIGPRGTGKTSVARIFAHAVNGFPYEVEDSYLDIIEIDAASNTGVDNIRELREKAIIAPTKGKFKVYIIDEVHMLTKSASNALLKTLEEPPAHVIFIMATTDAHKVPITISSRTQVHTFKLASPEVMQSHLRQIADTEGIKITDDALKIVVRRGGGSFRDSLSLLDQIASLSDDKSAISAEILETALGLPAEQAISDLLAAYSAQNSAQIRQILQDLLNTGLKPEVIASELIAKIVTKPEKSVLPLLKPLPNVQPPFSEAKLLLALLDQGSPYRPLETPPDASQGHSAPTAAPKTVSKITQNPPAPAPATDSPQTFDWAGFLEAVHQANDAVYSQLCKVSHDYVNGTIHLYPDKKFTKNILDKPGNRQIMTQCLSGASLVIHDPEERDAPKDGPISQISAIMGNIQEVKGDLPF